MNNLKTLAVNCCILILFTISSFNTKAQVQTPRTNIAVSSLCNGFYEYLPQGYSSGTGTYPLIVFVHGLGELGDGSSAQLPRVLANATPKQINEGTFPTSFTVKGQTFRFIVISPQFSAWPAPENVQDVIDYAVSHYRVDINRIYLTGLSMGGGVVWDYVGRNITYANRVAAIVPVAGATYPWEPYAQTIAAGNIRIWATHNELDPSVSVNNTISYVTYVDNASKSNYVFPDSLAKKTIFAGVASHDAWTKTYDLNFRENGLNIYEWMLLYKKSNVVLPVTGLQLNISKENNKALLNWTTYTELNNEGFTVERSADGTHFSTIAFVKSKSINNSGATYTYTDAAPLNGKNYYRLQQADANGVTKYSSIRFTDFSKAHFANIFPNPVRDIININTDYQFNNASLQIFNSNGQIVLSSKLTGSGTLSLPVQKLQAGIYAAQIVQQEQIIKLSFIKQ